MMRCTEAYVGRFILPVHFSVVSEWNDICLFSWSVIMSSASGVPDCWHVCLGAGASEAFAHSSPLLCRKSARILTYVTLMFGQ
jgi:hypothetical protein